MANRYTRALKQIKDKSLDEKLKLLEELPTNNTTGIFVDTPGVTTPERTEPGDIDSALNLNQDGDGAEGYTGNDTTGLFESDGTIRAIEPPGDTSYVLGPMMSMWYAWANYTQIGYVRQSDRKMVNLGRITGEMSDWDGVSGFTSYGQLTLEQAVWFKEQSRSDYRAFYPGPPSNPADEFGRYLGSMIDTTKDVFNLIRKTFTPGTQKGFDPSDVFSSILGLILRSEDSSFVDALKSLGVAGKVLLGYWTNQLPDVIDNKFLGQDYVDMAWTDMQLGYDRNGKPISVVKDNVIGSGQNPTYNPLTNEIELTFNYDFDTNAEAIAKEPEKYDRSNPITGSAMAMAQILGGDYGIDSSPVIPAGYGTMLAKAMGGAEHKPGKITISPQKLQQLNPQVFNQLVQRGDFPADAANQPSQNREAPRDGAEVDPAKAIESLKQQLPADQRAQLDFQKTMSMDNFNKLSKSDQNKIMNALQDRHKSRSDGSNFIDAPKYMKKQFKARAKQAGKTKFKDGYMIDKDPNTGKSRKTPIFSTIPGMSSVLALGHVPSGKLLTESQKRVLRDIKKPVKVKEMPTKFKVKPTGRKNKSVGVDMMKIPDVPKQYKPQTNIWGKADYAANVRASQEKKNEVLELVGAAEHHWTYLTEESRKKKQEKVNEMLSAEHDKQMELLYEKHRMKEAKITKAMSAFRKSADIKPEFPKEPPPQIDPKTGMHPKYGKQYKHDKLDPQSAESMPSTGNPEIDANIKKATNAKEKARKLKNLKGKNTIKEGATWDKVSKWKRKINEDMTTASLGMINYPAVGDVDLAQFDYSVEVVGSSPGFSKSGNDYTFGPASAGIPPAETSSLTFEMNSEIYDTIVFDFVNSGVINELHLVTGSDGGLSTYNISTSSGRKVVTLVPADRKKLVSVAWSIKRSAGGGLGTNKILNVSFQRRAPMNLFVGLDDPEANSFIRGGLGGDKEKRKQLKDMLDAGNQWMHIRGLEPSKTSPGDIALDTIPYEPPSPGPGGYKPPGSYNPNKFFDVPTNHGPQFPSPNLPSTGPGRSSAPGKDTQVARINDGPMDDPSNIQWPRNNPYKKPKPGPGYRPPVKTA